MELFLRDVYLENLEKKDFREALDYLQMRAEKLGTGEALARLMGEIFWMLLSKERLALTSSEEEICRGNLTALRVRAERENKGALFPALAGHLTQRWPWFFADCRVDVNDPEAIFRHADRRAAKLFAKALLTDPRNPMAAAMAYPHNADGKRNLPSEVKAALLDSLKGDSAIEYYLKNEIC